MLTLDHLVVCAASLDSATAWMTNRLGVPPAGHGTHVQMGTHNSLWRIGAAYLEVIAIDPDAAAPGRRRWFGLDDDGVQARLAQRPRLTAWVARSDDLAGDMARAPRDPGPPLAFRRDDLHWRLTVPHDGRPLWSGCYPALIEWPQGVTPPSATLRDDGLTLAAFAIDGPAALARDLAALGARHIVTHWRPADTPRLAARIARPDGGVAVVD